MPIYQYKCPSCGQSLDKYKSMAEAGQEELCFNTVHQDIVPMKRLWKPIAITYNSAGFYCTDNAPEDEKFSRKWLQDKQPDTFIPRSDPY